MQIVWLFTHKKINWKISIGLSNNFTLKLRLSWLVLFSWNLENWKGSPRKIKKSFTILGGKNCQHIIIMTFWFMSSDSEFEKGLLYFGTYWLLMVPEKVEEVLFLIGTYRKQFVIRNPESLNSIPAFTVTPKKSVGWRPRIWNGLIAR